MKSTRVEWKLLLILDTFLGLTAVGGGLGLLTGAIAPPLDLLQGSPFNTYAIPGLVLLGLVGGSALGAAGLLLRRHSWGGSASAGAGLMIMGFEIVEVLVIGSSPGLARQLQLFYLGLGLCMIALAIALRIAERTGSFGHVS
jgi:hypothetical protein